MYEKNFRYSSRTPHAFTISYDLKEIFTLISKTLRNKKYFISRQEQILLPNKVHEQSLI